MPKIVQNIDHHRQRVLVLSKEFSAQGGIVNFVASLMENMGPAIVFEHLSIGRNGGNRFRNLIFPLMDGINLTRRIRCKKYACVHINPSMNAKSVLRDGLILFILRLLRFRRILICFHGWEDVFAVKIRDSILFAKLFRAVFGRAPVILVLAARFREVLLDIGIKPEQVHVITTSFDSRIFTRLQPQQKDARSILFLSRFATDKGIYELLEAFEAIASRYSDLSLVMAGDGPEYNRMVQWVQAHNLSDRVRFTGYLRGRAKAQELINADLFVFPTYHGEGCPVSLLEAMAAGLPVVTTQAGGIPDIFEDRTNGIMLNEVTPAVIEEAIIKLLNDSQWCRRIRKNNLERAWRDFQAQAVANKIEALYLHVANGE